MSFLGASFVELSMVVTAAASAGVRGFEEAAELLAKKLKPSEASNPSVWLNSVHSVAFFERLTPKLAESVLREEFLNVILKEVK